MCDTDWPKKKLRIYISVSFDIHEKKINSCMYEQACSVHRTGCRAKLLFQPADKTKYSLSFCAHLCSRKKKETLSIAMQQPLLHYCCVCELIIVQSIPLTSNIDMWPATNCHSKLHILMTICLLAKCRSACATRASYEMHTAKVT